MKQTGSVGLLSAALSDTPGLEEITDLIIQKNGDFSIASLRAGAVNERLLNNMKRTGQKTLAIAPEAGSERLRKVINKHLSTDEIIEAVRIIAKTAEFSLRLYFLIGLPTETQEDVYDIIELVKSIKHHVVKESSTRGRIRGGCILPRIG